MIEASNPSLEFCVPACWPVITLSLALFWLNEEEQAIQSEKGNRYDHHYRPAQEIPATDCEVASIRWNLCGS